jgi:outer membrane protein TolC
MTYSGPARRAVVGLLAVSLAWAAGACGQEAPGGKDDLPSPRPLDAGDSLPPNPPSILPADWNPIDLPSTLRLAGVENPEILIARQRVVEVAALRMYAAAQLLPNINAGMNVDSHRGVLQQSSGNILRVDRDALNVGLGANAVAAGTVNIPGIFYNVNVSQAIFGWLEVRQVVRQREFESIAVRNDVLLRTATGYVELLRAEGLRAIAVRNRDEAREIARLTADYAITGKGKQSDADRAATVLARRNDLVLAAEGQVLTAAARLAQLLNLDPSLPLHATDGWVVPAPIVPDPIPLEQLLYVATQQRPELGAQRAAIREAALALHAAKVLPFSPNVLAGFSTSEFGGGSNLVARPGGFLGFAESRFGNFAQRADADVVLYWTAQNMGLGNCAQVKLARSQLRIADLELLRVLNQVRAEVATAYARTHARFAQIDVAERAVRNGQRAYQEDMIRVRGGKGLPIELLDSFRLLASARDQYLNAISDYNAAQFELYVALGQPPANTLARPIPSGLVPPPPAPPGGPGGAPCAPAVTAVAPGAAKP